MRDMVCTCRRRGTCRACREFAALDPTQPAVPSDLSGAAEKDCGGSGAVWKNPMLESLGMEDCAGCVHPDCPVEKEDWHKVWVWRDPITGTLRSTTGAAELSSIPPASSIRRLARIYVPGPPPLSGDSIREELLGSAAAVEVLARRSYEQMTGLPFGRWEKVPEKYKVGFRERAQHDLDAALDAALSNPEPKDNQGDQEGSGQGGGDR